VQNETENVGRRPAGSSGIRVVEVRGGGDVV